VQGSGQGRQKRHGHQNDHQYFGVQAQHRQYATVGMYGQGTRNTHSGRRISHLL
jgi:hypothetical protein